MLGPPTPKAKCYHLSPLACWGRPPRTQSAITCWGRPPRKQSAITDGDVVIYSNPFDNWGDEGRMFWMLEYLGHKKLRVLDGGWVRWTAEKRPFEHGGVTPVAGTFKAQLVKSLAMTKEDLKEIVRRPHPHTAILDARSLEEYLGKEVSGIPRPGHIPSAVHVAWNGFLNKDATIKDLDAIKGML